MTATAHALIGGAIAASVSNPMIGLPLAALSHPLADMIPHWDFGWGWRQKTKLKLFLQGSFDLLLGVILAYFIFGQNIDIYYLLACIFFSEVWDIIQAPYWLFNWKFPPFSSFYSFQHAIQGKAKLPWGIITQAVTVTTVVFLLKYIH